MHFAAVDHFVGPFPGRRDSGTVNASKQTSFGDDLEGLLARGRHGVDVRDVGFDVKGFILRVRLDNLVSCFDWDDVEDLAI